MNIPCWNCESAKRSLDESKYLYIFGLSVGIPLSIYHETLSDPWFYSRKFLLRRFASFNCLIENDNGMVRYSHILPGTYYNTKSEFWFKHEAEENTRDILVWTLFALYIEHRAHKSKRERPAESSRQIARVSSTHNHLPNAFKFPSHHLPIQHIPILRTNHQSIFPQHPSPSSYPPSSNFSSSKPQND